MDITYNGPDAWIGILGHFLIILAFVSAIVSGISYWVSAKFHQSNLEKENSWRQLGKTSFFVHALSVLSVVSLVFYILAARKYMYAYAYAHVSNELPFRYLFSAFWEGQEGSTLLWMFWHSILGLIMIFRIKKWQAPVLGTVALVQAFLVSMVLGLFVFGHRIGINPFQLLRSTATNAPIFELDPNFIPKDGNGLNELLRNYWMVIHPPTIFLGFASVTIPFGFALGGLYWRDLKGWITPSLPWVLFAGGVLGIGILMGGAWAYESLSFGGFWVWDPVENASLVPWLLIVSALHLMLVYKNTGYSGLPAFILIILSFLMIAYSTFLTKSGVLGESSVHSFTDLGMSGQLIVFIIFFWFVSFSLLLSDQKFRLIYALSSLTLFILYLFIGQAGYILIAFLLLSFSMLAFIYDFPKRNEEEQLWSREFWMFVGSLVILLSAMHIVVTTSFPVYNRLFSTELIIEEVQDHYDSIQIIPAIIMLLLSAVVMYFKYNKEVSSSVLKKLTIPFLLAIVGTIAFIVIYDFKNVIFILLLFASWFAIFANIGYVFTVLKGNIRISGPSVAHLGFAVLLLGVVVSQTKKTVLSKNTRANVNVSEDDPELNENNIMLYQDETVKMGKYLVTMKEDVEGKLRDGVIIDFKELEDGKIKDEFIMIPKFKPMGESLVSDPAIKRGLFSDIFAPISLLALDIDQDSTKYDPLIFKQTSENGIVRKDTVAYDRVIYILNKLEQGTTRTDFTQNEGDIVISAHLDVLTKDSIYKAEPVYVINSKNGVKFIEDEIPEEKLSIRIQEINPEKQHIEIGVKSSKPFKNYILLKVMLFPLINLVWLGSILMFIGFIMSMITRMKVKGAKE